MKMRYSMGLYLCMAVLLPYHESCQEVTGFICSDIPDGFIIFERDGMGFSMEGDNPARTLVAWMFAVGISFLFLPAVL